jgi:hypothetical protein
MFHIRWRLVIGNVALGVILGGGIGWYASQPVKWQLPTDEQTNLVVNKPPVITLKDDPQYVVMNFAPMNELNWAAPEPEWEAKIKPKILAELETFKASLPTGSPQRRLAWSTLMEYMNFPLDNPGPNSAYVIKVRRIFEISQAEDMPVFVPLNGFQWWDELPELYNWWDPDGTHTDERFFARQDNPVDFKKRFIAGYDPQNKANVEWQDWQTPMQLNWRNWGGGGFRLAPPPNLVEHSELNKKGLSYRKVQRERFTAIVTEIVAQVKKLEAAGKPDLFAGISIGTEVSLNASATPADEFKPYGYRAMQDLASRSDISVESLKHDALAQQQFRQQAVGDYLTDLSWLATQLGIPMQRVYTHVWSEALIGEPRYMDYAAAAYNDYSRPGISLYGYATKPFELPVWQRAMNQAGMPAWGAVEYSLPKAEPDATTAINQIFLNVEPRHPAAKTTVLYNWNEHNNSVDLAALTRALSALPAPATCTVSEIIEPQTTWLGPNGESDKQYVSWRWLNEQVTSPDDVTVVVKFYPGVVITNSTLPTATVPDPLTSDLPIAVPELKPGVYSWLVEAEACGGIRRHSQPQTLIISPPLKLVAPRWVQWWLRWQNERL